LNTEPELLISVIGIMHCTGNNQGDRYKVIYGLGYNPKSFLLYLPYAREVFSMHLVGIWDDFTSKREILSDYCDVVTSCSISIWTMVMILSFWILYGWNMVLATLACSWTVCKRPISRTNHSCEINLRTKVSTLNY